MSEAKSLVEQLHAFYARHPQFSHGQMAKKAADTIEGLMAESEARHQSCLVLIKSVTDHRTEIERLTRELWDQNENIAGAREALRRAAETTECLYTQIDASQWKMGCGERYPNGNFQMIGPYCNGCGKRIAVKTEESHG